MNFRTKIAIQIIGTLINKNSDSKIGSNESDSVIKFTIYAKFCLEPGSDTNFNDPLFWTIQIDNKSTHVGLE